VGVAWSLPLAHSGTSCVTNYLLEYNDWQDKKLLSFQIERQYACTRLDYSDCCISEGMRVGFWMVAAARSSDVGQGKTSVFSAKRRDVMANGRQVGL
jgi:hypothetical protein